MERVEILEEFDVADGGGRQANGTLSRVGIGVCEADMVCQCRKKPNGKAKSDVSSHGNEVFTKKPCV